MHVQIGLARRAACASPAGCPPEGQQRFAVMDIAGAQSNFDRLGPHHPHRPSPVRPGVDVDDLRARARRRCCPQASRSSARRRASPPARACRARIASTSNVLALVALFTGGLLVFSTQALAVVRRRAQFALLRVLGVTRRRSDGADRRSKARSIGVVGQRAGDWPVDSSLAQLARAHRSAPISAPDIFAASHRRCRSTPSRWRLFFCLGVADRDARQPRARARGRARGARAALKAGDEERAFARLCARSGPGSATIVRRRVAALLPPVAGLPLFGYTAIALLLIGTLMLMPRIAAMLLARCPMPRAPPPRLALLQLRGAPGQVAVSLAAIVASVSLMVSMAIMVASFRDSLDAWLERVLPADLYVRAAPPATRAYLGAGRAGANRRAAGRAARRVPARAAAAARSCPAARRAAGAQRSTRCIRAAAAAGQRCRVDVASRRAAAGMGERGDGRSLRFCAGLRSSSCRSRAKPCPFTVAGVWRDYARPQGAVVDRARALYRADRRSHARPNGALWLAAGANVPDRARRCDRARHPRRRAARASRRPGEIRELSLQGIRSHVRGHLCARARRGRHRPVRIVVVVRRAGARAPPRVRRAAPPRHDAAADRRDARDRRLVVSAIGLAVGFGARLA